jgi:hypothetical protein
LTDTALLFLVYHQCFPSPITSTLADVGAQLLGTAGKDGTTLLHSMLKEHLDTETSTLANAGTSLIGRFYDAHIDVSNSEHILIVTPMQDKRKVS